MKALILRLTKATIILAGIVLGFFFIALRYASSRDYPLPFDLPSDFEPFINTLFGIGFVPLVLYLLWDMNRTQSLKGRPLVLEQDEIGDVSQEKQNAPDQTRGYLKGYMADLPSDYLMSRQLRFWSIVIVGMVLFYLVKEILPAQWSMPSDWTAALETVPPVLWIGAVVLILIVAADSLFGRLTEDGTKGSETSSRTALLFKRFSVGFAISSFAFTAWTLNLRTWQFEPQRLDTTDIAILGLAVFACSLGLIRR